MGASMSGLCLKHLNIYTLWRACDLFEVRVRITPDPEAERSPFNMHTVLEGHFSQLCRSGITRLLLPAAAALTTYFIHFCFCIGIQERFCDS